jgi:hypothetical protein
MVHISGGFEVVIHRGEIMKAIADGYNPGYLGLTGFLDDNELLNRVFHNQTHMGMSIKILHGLVHKEKNVFYSKLDILMITQLLPGVNKNPGTKPRQSPCGHPVSGIGIYRGRKDSGPGF